MRRARKGKKMMRILLIALIAIIIIVSIVIIIVKKGNKDKDETVGEQQTTIPLPDTTYSGMEVKDIYMEYLEEQDKTMVSMSIVNTRTNIVENESLNAILLDAKGKTLGQMPTWIQSLGVGEQYDISVILNGNLTGTQSIQLQKVKN